MHISVKRGKGNNENFLKVLIKINADIQFLKFCLNNQLLPKFTNFKLYYVSAQNENTTIQFKVSLFQREIKKKEDDLTSKRKSRMQSVLNFLSTTSKLRFYSAILFLSRIFEAISL